MPFEDMVEHILELKETVELYDLSMEYIQLWEKTVNDFKKIFGEDLRRAEDKVTSE